MISYYKSVLDVIRESIKSIPEREYEQLLHESIQTRQNGVNDPV